MLSDYQTLVIQLVRDDAARIDTTARDSAIALAVTRYSQDRPRTKVEDVASQTGQLLGLPTGWQTDFSGLQSIETPVGSVPPEYVARDRWDLYDAPSGTKVMLTDAVSNATLRFTYTIRHVVDAVTDTIVIEDREAVAKYAAHLLCHELAAFYANDTDSTIQADRAQGTSRAGEYRSLARQYKDFYNAALGIDDKKPEIGGTVVNLNVANRRNTLFHYGQRRV